MLQKDIILSKRLLNCANCVRHGKACADIGTDHAYLPIYLVQSGISPSVFACDINEGPLKKADENIKRYSLSEKIQTVLTDGLKGLEQFPIENIIIAGMGSETIKDIILSSPCFHSQKYRFILQPMTKANILRKALYDNGFDIIDERLTLDADRIYQTIVAVFDGKAHLYDDFSLLVGKEIYKNRQAFKEEYALHTDAISNDIKNKLKNINLDKAERQEYEKLLLLLKESE